jgi:endonuclease G
MIKEILILAILGLQVFAIDASLFINTKRCSKIIDKQIYTVCYDYELKGARAVHAVLDGELVNKTNIKKRPRFYSEKNVPMRARSKYKDYTNSGYDRGHILSDASADYDRKVLNKAYSLINIVPQAPYLNRNSHTWIAAEKLERSTAKRLGRAEVLNIIIYDETPKRIGANQIAVPSGFLKAIYNNNKGFARCFLFKNVNPTKGAKERLSDFEVSCDSL